MDAKVGQIEQTLNQHMTMTSSNLEQLYGEQKTMTQSIATALQRQDDRLAASMDELKSIQRCQKIQLRRWTEPFRRRLTKKHYRSHFGQFCDATTFNLQHCQP